MAESLNDIQNALQLVKEEEKRADEKRRKTEEFYYSLSKKRKNLEEKYFFRELRQSALFISRDQLVSLILKYNECDSIKERQQMEAYIIKVRDSLENECKSSYHQLIVESRKFIYASSTTCRRRFCPICGAMEEVLESNNTESNFKTLWNYKRKIFIDDKNKDDLALINNWRSALRCPTDYSKYPKWVESDDLIDVFLKQFTE